VGGFAERSVARRPVFAIGACVCVRAMLRVVGRVSWLVLAAAASGLVRVCLSLFLFRLRYVLAMMVVNSGCGDG
jgi:hypothetical protein